SQTKNLSRFFLLLKHNQKLFSLFVYFLLIDNPIVIVKNHAVAHCYKHSVGKRSSKIEINSICPIAFNSRKRNFSNHFMIVCITAFAFALVNNKVICLLI